jgi:hypothetical protein
MAEASEQTKEQLVKQLGSRTKDELVSALGSHLTKDDLVSLLESRLKKDELLSVLEKERDQGDEGERGRQDEASRRGSRADSRREGAGGDEDNSLDWSAELDWAPAPRPTPAPVRYRGGAPSMPGQRVRVDLAGLPMLGVFLGRGASAAGTITGVDARRREVTVFLDAGFDGQKEIVVPPERVTPDG